MPLFGDTRLLYVIVLVSFLFILGYAVSEPIKPLYVVQVGASPLELGFIMALPSLVSILTRVPSSALSNKLGRWRLMLFSVALSVVSTFLYAFINKPVWFYPIVSLAAFSWSAFSPIAIVIVSAQSTPTTRGAIMGMYFTAIGAAMLCGPLLCSLLAIFMGLRQLFLFSVAFPLLALVVFLLKSKMEDLDQNQAADETEAKVDEGSLSSIARIFRNRNVVGLCCARVAFSFSMGVFSTLFSVYAEGSLGFTPSLIALLFSFRGFTNVLVRMPAGRLSDRIGRMKPFSLAYGIVIVVFALLAFARNFTVLAIVMALYGVGWGMRVAPSTAMLSESVAPEDRPLALATFMTMFDVGATMGALTAGAAATMVSTPTLLLLCAPIMLPALALFLILSTEDAGSQYRP